MSMRMAHFTFFYFYSAALWSAWWAVAATTCLIRFATVSTTIWLRFDGRSTAVRLLIKGR